MVQRTARLHMEKGVHVIWTKAIYGYDTLGGKSGAALLSNVRDGVVHGLPESRAHTMGRRRRGGS